MGMLAERRARTAYNSKMSFKNAPAMVLVQRFVTEEHVENCFYSLVVQYLLCRKES